MISVMSISSSSPSPPNLVIQFGPCLHRAIPAKRVDYLICHVIDREGGGGGWKGLLQGGMYHTTVVFYSSIYSRVSAKRWHYSDRAIPPPFT